MSAENDTPEAGEKLTRAERIFVRLSILQTILAVAGIFTGVVALYAALSEADAVRKQQAASVLPEIVVAQSHVIGGDAPFFSWNAFNWGIGPGRVRALQVRYKDEPVHDWSELLNAIGVSGDVSYIQSQLAGRTLPAGETSEIFRITSPEAARVIRDASADVSMELCYCSVFDQCWMMPQTLLDGPQPVKACPDFGEDGFVQ